ncbi:MAG: prolipoprotein diacylglyceryl transferase [Spirochaetota bacterium]|nr:prolipoprotein diacylglyceryl transferase [Spirochaetota bacterium]
MHQKIFKIPLAFLSGEMAWVIFILAAVLAFAFYYLVNIEKRKGDQASKKLILFINILFYLSFFAGLITLFHIAGMNSLDFNSYGFMLAIAFILGVYLIVLKARKEGIAENTVMDLSLWGILLAVVGARLFFMLFEHWDGFIKDPLIFFNLTAGGMVVYGGFVFGIVFSLIYVKKKSLPLGQLADIFAPSLALGVGITRLGCFLAGCCWGSTCHPDHLFGVPLSLFETDSPVYVTMSPENALEASKIFLYPSQIFSALNGIILFVILQVLYTKYRHRFPYRGFLFHFFMIYYAISRLLIEFTRNDTPKDYLGLSAAQFIGILVIILSLGLIIYNYRRRPAHSS